MEQKLQVLQEQFVVGASPCEAELQELIHQIDIMVNNKKLEWERKVRALEARMDVRDQELANAQSKLDLKGQEVGILRQKLDSLQKTKYEMAQDFEAQLQALKSQFCKLTQSYEKLQLHQIKQDRVHSKEICAENLETPFELSNLNQKLEEFKAKSKEWDQKETLYQNHLISLDAQRKLLSEKCNLFQKQTQNYRFQISNKNQKQEDAATSSQSKIERDEFIIEKLKSTVNEIAINRNKLQEENLKLQQELTVYQTQCQNMEAGLSEMRNELQSRDALWRGMEAEFQQLHKELLKIGECKNIQENQMKLQSAYAQCIQELEDKKAELLKLEQHQESQQKELNKIRDHLYQEKQSHSSEQERMRTEISDLTEELHQKEITIATIMEKATLLERKLKMELEIKEKLLAKQQLSEMRYEAIRSENTHLKKMIENLESRRYMTIDLSNTEHESYTASIHELECENERLRNNLGKLQSDSETSILATLDRYGETKHAKQIQLEMQEKEERNQNLTLHGQGDIIGTKSGSSLPSQRLSRDHDQKLDGKSPSPPMFYPSHYNSPFPEKHRCDVVLSHVYSVEEVNPMVHPEMSLPTTSTEKFFQEEEKRAKEFEEILNSHIEELQRHSENTVKKYARLKQNRHI
ncbi:deuterosome assembly protein 1 [Chelonia mydas]|uniref:deuterosome assembly protein 1 n=1 Tax=Chelonia mydas TaxID=8469 RepID=UPI0018A1DB62|nr:deuterosome assembly protein 1 [Chelonia mydas]XP_043384739.1 deuterosome assembly protein 1 [Chelonia mydas]